MTTTRIVNIEPFVKISDILLQCAGNFSAGFPSPANDYLDNPIDLNSLIKHPSSTFWGKVSGRSLEKIGIFDNDLLIIDKAIRPENGRYAVCYLDGDFTAKRIQKEGKRLFLMPENDTFKPIEVTEDNNFLVWGVIILSIKQL